MPLRVWDIVEQRLAVLQEPEWSGRSVREVCRRNGISPDTFYAWKRRYARDGLSGLSPQSRRPASSPRQLVADVEDEIVRLRKQHGWGPRKIRDQLVREGMSDPPARSTIEQVLARRGFGTRVRPPRPRSAEGGTRFARAECNELWQVDGSLHHLADGSPYWVVDLIDDCSRFCPAILVGSTLTGALAWDAFRAAVAAVGLPAALLSDNGLCFTGRLHQRVVMFERQVAAAGSRLHHSRPYHPQTCGKVERLHQTARGWLARRGRPATLHDAQALFDAFRAHYNYERPHQALDGAAPGDIYQPGAAVELPVLDLDPADSYPLGCQLRKVSRSGQIGYHGKLLGVGERWAGLTVGIITDTRRLHVYYGSALIDTFSLGTIRRRDQ